MVIGHAEEVESLHSIIEDKNEVIGALFDLLTAHGCDDTKIIKKMFQSRGIDDTVLEKLIMEHIARV